MGFKFFQVVYISMPDIKHKLCKHADQSYKMQRLYKRVNAKFIPCAWVCPDCGQMQKD